MKRLTPIISISDIAAIGTWLAVFSISLYWLNSSKQAEAVNQAAIIGAFLLYIFCFIAITRTRTKPLSMRLVSIYLTVMLSAAFLLLVLLPISFLPILTIIWCSLLPHFFSMFRSTVIMLIVLTAWFLTHKFHWQSNVFFAAILYGTFHFFALMMTYHVRIAEQATEETTRLNRELISTRELLQEASRHSERTRIARDLHDLLGHHLTALLINLQVASRLSSGDAKQRVEQCHSLAKLLLSDVREAVSTLRQEQPFDLNKMIDLLSENLPDLSINHTIDEAVNRAQLEQLTTLLFCIQEGITNCVKHSNATELSIELFSDQLFYRLVMSNSSPAARAFVAGNGLKGMKERAALLGGSMTATIENGIFQAKVSLPKTFSADRNRVVAELEIANNIASNK